MAEDWSYPKLGILGVLAGIVAGLAMWLFMSIITLFTDGSVWALSQWIASAILGDTWLGFHPGEILTGLGIHLVVSLVLGVLFALLTVPFIASERGLLISGIVWGIVAWVLLSALAMNAVDETMAQQVPHIPWFIAHLVFGAVLALVITPLRSAATTA